MRTVIKNVKIVTASEVLENCACTVENRIITKIGKPTFPADREIDGENGYLIPGFIDLHCHGGNGVEVMDAAPQGLKQLAAFHLSHGTTTMLATTLTASDEETYAALDAFSAYQNEVPDGVLELDRGSTEASRKADAHEIRIEYKDGKEETVKVQKLSGTHNGSDEKLIKMLLLGEGKEEDLLHQCADSYAGFTSAMIGVAGNESIETGKTVDLTERLRSLQ